jgi:hypothetical protein
MLRCAALPVLIEVAEPLPEPLNEPDRAKFVGLVPLRFNAVPFGALTFTPPAATVGGAYQRQPERILGAAAERQGERRQRNPGLLEDITDLEASCR